MCYDHKSEIRFLSSCLRPVYIQSAKHYNPTRFVDSWYACDIPECFLVKYAVDYNCAHSAKSNANKTIIILRLKFTQSKTSKSQIYMYWNTSISNIDAKIKHNLINR